MKPIVQQITVGRGKSTVRIFIPYNTLSLNQTITDEENEEFIFEFNGAKCHNGEFEVYSLT